MNHGRFSTFNWAPVRNVLLILGLISAVSGGSPPAFAAPPEPTHRPEPIASFAPPVDPAASTRSAAAAIQPEIQAIAAGLDNNPLLIYDYVLNNFDTVPAYGLLQNPRETVLSKRGNPFDQAALLSDLLRAAGYETQYVLGIVQLPAAGALNWVGADNLQMAQRVIDAGGTYSEIAGDGLRVKHLWLRARIDGTWHALDPSMKSYAYTKGMDLGPILGYNRDEYLAAALSGAAVTADYAENLNVANVAARLTRYSSNLAEYLRDKAPFAYLADVVGGRSIVTQTVKTLPAQLPYAVERELGTWSDLPREAKYQMHVELPGLDFRTSIPDIAGERVTITYAGATDADRSAIAAAGGIDKVYPAYRVQMVPELRLGGVLGGRGRAVSLGSTQPVTVSVETPFSIGDNRVIWRARPKTLTAGAFYALPLSVEGTSEKALQRHHQLLQGFRAAGPAEQSEPVRGESLHLIGASYFNQVEASGRLSAALAHVLFVPRLSAAFTSQNLIVTTESVEGKPQPARVAWGSYGIDVALGQMTMRSAAGDGEAARAFVTHLEFKASAAEHAVLEQLQRNPGISTVKALALALDAQVRIYRLTAANIEALLPALDQTPVVKGFLRLQVAQGRVVIVPQRRLVRNAWQGTGFWSYDPASGELDGLISGQMIAASTLAPNEAPTLGGDSTVVQEIIALLLDWLLETGPNVGTGCNQTCNSAGSTLQSAVFDPIDTTTGAFLYETTDLAFGRLGYPIEFKRTYVSDRRNASGPLGSGWTHSYAMRLDSSSDWARGLGYRTAMDAVAAIAEAYVDLDLARAPVEGLGLDRLLAGTAGAHWATAQVIDNVVTVTGPDGSHRQYQRLPDGRYQPGHHDYHALVVNADGTRSLVNWRGGRIDFDARGRATAEVDANGNRTSLAYDGQGRLTRITDAGGRAIDLAYTGERVTQIVDPAGRVLRYDYDARGNLTAYTDPLGNVTRYAYDAERRLTSLTNPESVTTARNEYDDLNRVIRQTDGRGSVFTLRYGDAQTVVTDALGNRAVYYYDRRQRMTGMGDHYGNRTYIVYDANDNILRTTNRAGRTTSYAYDARGNRARIVDALGHVTEFAYDAHDNLIGMTDRMGATTRYEYDERRNLVRVTDPLGRTTAYTYDDRGQRTSMTDANGHSIHWGYDAPGNLTRAADGLGHATTLTYDNLGRVHSLADAGGHTTRYEYDAAGQVLRVADRQGGVSVYSYDRNGLVTAATDALGRTTRYGYDVLLQLTVVTDTVGSVTRYTYDPNSHMTGMTDANGHTTRYTRDALGRLVQITDPLGRVVRVAYDANDRQVALTKADGRTIAYEYDLAGRLTRTAYPDGSAATTVYDAAGRVTGSTYGTWQAQHTYDAAGQLVRTDLSAGGLAVASSYDLAGNRLAVEVRKGSERLYDARYVYDAANRMVSATDALTGYAASFTYGDDDTLVTVQHSSGARAAYAYDAAHRVTQVDHFDAGSRSLSSYAYTYDAVGNLLRTVQTTLNGAVTTNYNYDDLDRLVREQHAGSSVEYAYDPAGNRAGETGPQGTVTYRYDAADQLLSAGPVTLEYDANGNQVRRTDAGGISTFSYDDANRLVQIMAPGNARSIFRVDAAGRRVAAENPAGAHQMVYDGEHVILERATESGQGQAFLWGAGTVVAARPLGAPAAPPGAGYLGDRLGNVTTVTDAAGQLRSAYSYDAFGRAPASSPATADPMRFVGQFGVRVEPAVSNLYSMGYRTYDAATGRFLTIDPLPGDLARPESLHRYAYVLNNPLRYTDPLGLHGKYLMQMKNSDLADARKSATISAASNQPGQSDQNSYGMDLGSENKLTQAFQIDSDKGGGDGDGTLNVTISQGENVPPTTVEIRPGQTQEFIDIMTDLLMQGS